MKFIKGNKEQDMAGDKAMEAIEEQAKESFGWKGYLLYYFGYTLLFGVMAAAVFVWFFLKRRRFVWQTDGVNQHYYGLVYFSRWGKEVLRHFKETGALQFPTFTLRMGYGGDLYTTLAYYVIGDPFSLPAVFVPEKYLLHYHDLMLLARFWLAGITFSAYNFYIGHKNRIGVLAGAMIYIFNGFTLSGMRHHYFLNPFVFFPLLLIGCELYFRKKRPWLFLLMVFVTAVSNFYFFYMMVILTVLYAVWRSVRLHGLRHFGAVILDGIAFIWYGLIGMLLSSFIFLPIILQLMKDPRTADQKQIPLFWPLFYYRNFIDCFLTNGTSALSESWTYMGFGALALLSVFFIFIQAKKHFDLKAAFVILTLFLLTPTAGYILNGFSYSVNRWMWAYALLVGTMTAAAIPELVEAGAKKLLAALLLLLAAVGICVGWEYTFSRCSANAVILAIVGLAAVLLGRLAILEKTSAAMVSEDNSANGMEQSMQEDSKYKRKISLRVEAVLLVCVMLTIASNSYFNFAPDRSAKTFEYLSRAKIETNMAKDAKAASNLIDGQLLKAEADENGKVPFYRYSAVNPENNTSLIYGVSNTQYYWSTSEPSIAQFMNETGQLNLYIDMYDSLDDRTFLNEIAGIRYFLGSDEEGVPYGYEKKEGLSYSNNDLWPDIEGLERYSCEVYENKYALPFGFATDKWISREDFNAMDIPERQQAMMQGIVLEKDPGGDFTRMRTLTSAKLSRKEETADSGREDKEEGKKLIFTDESIPVQIEYKGETVPAERGKKIKLEAVEGGEKVTVRFTGMKECETALYIHGLEYTPAASGKSPTKMILSVNGYAGERTAATKQIGFTTPDNPWTTRRRDFYVNMRYWNEALDHIELILPVKGTYTFDAIEVVCQPMTGYVKQAEALRAFGLNNLDIHEMGDSFATDRITGHIDLETPQILCLQIPCMAGWKAYVDGAGAELLQADTMFSAILLPAGNHDIELRYQTPGLRLGAAVSLGTLAVLALFLIIYTIISLILHNRDKRVSAIPIGTFEKAEGAETPDAAVAIDNIAAAQEETGLIGNPGTWEVEDADRK